MAGQERPGVAVPAAACASAESPAVPTASRPRSLGRTGLLAKLSKRLEAHGIVLQSGILSDGARRELLLRGLSGTATVLGVRPSRMAAFGASAAARAGASQAPAGADPAADAYAGADGEPGYRFWVRIRVDDEQPYETRVRQRVSHADLELMQPGDVIGCRVDPGDRERLVLYVPSAAEATRVSIAKILRAGRRADATVLAATPVAADYSGRDNPVLRLDLELRAWDEPQPWRVRILSPVPLTAIELVDLGRHLEVAFFAVDRGESVAVDWAASTPE